MCDDRKAQDAFADIEKRLKALKEQNAAGKERRALSGSSAGRTLWLAFNVVSDLLGGVLCGLGIGYLLDERLGTRPAFIAVFLLFGCAGGVLNAVRFVQRYDQKLQDRPQSENTDGGKE